MSLWNRGWLASGLLVMAVAVAAAAVAAAVAALCPNRQRRKRTTATTTTTATAPPPPAPPPTTIFQGDGTAKIFLEVAVTVYTDNGGDVLEIPAQEYSSVYHRDVSFGISFEIILSEW
ncbi:hypothetical protein TRIATDRAFT_87927 [Trichoderma atroviride IMI 206040]|uniref:Uncharacterized protein n=1 Tax=Hypocrea atroviridis (strain ATCC 20476 / IMI 206040) TaxID=452589 RepID=G9NW10_HYPAI|nr:uncharacterized protein TRIATDRAFT_87927 [Trichoderma atroviride IMI 206040]EHK45175.1 hypothetical protein TRIATDRAFT_87927 [Trichoderma atroviride IMI 206040]